MFKHSRVKKHPSSWGQVETRSHNEGRKQFSCAPGQKGPELGTGVETRKGTTCFLSWGKTLVSTLFSSQITCLSFTSGTEKKGTGFGVRVGFRLRFAHFQAV